MVDVRKVLETMRMSCCQIIPLQGVNDSNLREPSDVGDTCSLLSFRRSVISLMFI
jgi:hypothetical protein